MIAREDYLLRAIRRNVVRRFVYSVPLPSEAAARAFLAQAEPKIDFSRGRVVALDGGEYGVIIRLSLGREGI